MVYDVSKRVENTVSRRNFFKLLGAFPFAFGSAGFAKAETAPIIYRPVLKFLVAGAYYQKAEGLAALAALRPLDQVRLIAEPNNSYDDHAIGVYHISDSVKLGFVPRVGNRDLHRLLVQNVPVIATVEGAVLPQICISQSDALDTIAHTGFCEGDPIIQASAAVALAT